MKNLFEQIWNMSSAQFTLLLFILVILMLIPAVLVVLKVCGGLRVKAEAA